LDNLSANKTPAIRHWAKRANVELCFTPANASWANPIEPQFGPVRTFVLGGSDYRNHTVLARKLQDYLRWRNANARHPDVLAAQRRERARIRSERRQRWGRTQPEPGPHDQPGRCPSAAHQPRRQVNPQRVCLSQSCPVSSDAAAGDIGAEGLLADLRRPGTLRLGAR
jgi:hypothetical protein